MTTADDVVSYASTEIGKPYVYGDEGPNSFDCSGLMQWVFAHVGISLPRTAEQQQQFAQPVSNPRPGDLVFWGRPAYHVGLYVGNGMMIAAPQPGERVQLQKVFGVPSGYGRVPGLGLSQAIAPVVAGIGAAADTVSSTAANILGGARYTVLEGLLVLTGVGLVGYGLVRAVRPSITKQLGDLL